MPKPGRWVWAAPVLKRKCQKMHKRFQNSNVSEAMPTFKDSVNQPPKETFDLPEKARRAIHSTNAGVVTTPLGAIPETDLVYSPRKCKDANNWPFNPNP